MFLPLFIVDGDKFNFIIKENDEYLKLKLNSKSFDIKTIRFKASKNQMVFGRRYGSKKKYFFIPVYKKNHPSYNKNTDENFEWIMDIQEAHALRVVNRYISNLSRIGLDESEWLRRLSND